MRPLHRSSLRALALLAAPLALAPAADARARNASPTLTYTLSERLRHESVEWFGSQPDPDRASYGFAANQLRFHLRLDFRRLALGVEGQHTLLDGLPADAGVGPGASYFAAGGETHQDEAFLRQAFLEARAGDLTATLGRFDHADGLEAPSADPALGWLRRNRVAERLVGPFGWSHVGRSFQGVRLALDRPVSSATFLVARPTAGGFLVDAGDPLADVGLALVSGAVRPRPGGAPAEARAFALLYEDVRPLVKVDNRPAGDRLQDRDAIRLVTIGGHSAAIVSAGRASLDALLWGAIQDGEWGRLDHRAWAFALEGGAQWRAARWKPWLRAGWNLSSGDRDPADGRHGTLFQVLPTARIYAQFPFYNLMNLDDRFAQLVLAPRAGCTARLDVHELRLAQPSDLWYAGAGATSERAFGVSGLPSGGHRNLATLVDASISARLREHLSVQAYLGRGLGAAAVAHSFSRRNATYGFLELIVRH